MLNQSFKFGIEIEFANANLTQVENTMREAGINLRREGYNHTRRDYWKLVTDQTVSTGGYSYHAGTGDGGELVSPVLCGEDGLRELEAALDALNSHPDVRIDRRCGLHVHLSWDNMQAEHIKEIVRRYAKFENQIDRWMPRSRRGSSCSWCSSTIDNSVDRVGDMSDLSARRAGMQRECKINLDAYSRHGTIEFRHHSGTTEYTKISNWVKFLIAFAQKSIELSPLTSAPAPAFENLPMSTRAYNSLRTAIEIAGGQMTYSGKKWTVTGSNNLPKTYTIDELNQLHAGSEFGANWQDWDKYDWRLKASAFTEFFHHHFPAEETETEADDNEPETVFRGVPQDVVDYLESRTAELS